MVMAVKLIRGRGVVGTSSRALRGEEHIRRKYTSGAVVKRRWAPSLRVVRNDR